MTVAILDCDPRGTLARRFWSKVRKTDGCWLWTAAVDAKGYGRLKVAGRVEKAHHVSFELHYGRPPSGLCCQTCDTPACVRPDHLFEEIGGPALLDRTCEICGSGFRVKPHRVATRRGRFCSTACLHEHRAKNTRRPAHDLEWVRSRFESVVDRNGPTPGHVPHLGQCHVWTAGKTRGYGSMQFARKTWLAHRFALFLETGRVPAQCVLHACDNPACVNPKHLFEGSKRDNTRDMMAKGRQRFGRPRGEASPFCKLRTDDVIAIRALFLLGLTRGWIAERLSVGRANVEKIVNRQTWAHI